MVVYTFEVCVKGQREPKKLKFGVGVEMCVSHNMKCASVVIEDELLCFDNGKVVPQFLDFPQNIPWESPSLFRRWLSHSSVLPPWHKRDCGRGCKGTEMGSQVFNAYISHGICCGCC